MRKRLQYAHSISGSEERAFGKRRHNLTMDGKVATVSTRTAEKRMGEDITKVSTIRELHKVEFCHL